MSSGSWCVYSLVLVLYSSPVHGCGAVPCMLQVLTEIALNYRSSRRSKPSDVTRKVFNTNFPSALPSRRARPKKLLSPYRRFINTPFFADEGGLQPEPNQDTQRKQVLRNFLKRSTDERPWSDEEDRVCHVAVLPSGTMCHHGLLAWQFLKTVLIQIMERQVNECRSRGEDVLPNGKEIPGRPITDVSCLHAFLPC